MINIIDNININSIVPFQVQSYIYSPTASGGGLHLYKIASENLLEMQKLY